MMNKTATYSYVNEHLISRSLICPICLDILEEPLTHVPCDSAFCRSCVLQLVEPLCPICRWTWDDSIPLHYNIYLPKASRLIRNMLDDLLVECSHCHTIRRRGEFEHDCSSVEYFLPIKTKTWAHRQMILSIVIIVLFLLLIYNYRHHVFEKGIDRHDELIKEIGYNIDYLVLEKLYYLIIKLSEYSMTMFIMNICLWFNIKVFGDRFTSKINIQILKNFFEIFIIVNLITYSIYH
jgi:hypothetical protein